MSGLGIAVCAAIVFICLFWVAKNNAFSGDGQLIFEGFMFLIASYLITIVAFAMLKFKNYEKKLEAKLTAAANVRPLPKLSPTGTSSSGWEDVLLLLLHLSWQQDTVSPP